jgi:hypothetical protein
MKGDRVKKGRSRGENEWLWLGWAASGLQRVARVEGMGRRDAEGPGVVLIQPRQERLGSQRRETAGPWSWYNLQARSQCPRPWTATGAAVGAEDPCVWTQPGSVTLACCCCHSCHLEPRISLAMEC